MGQNLVTIARYRDPPQAGLDKSILEDQGILCFLDNEFTIGVNWLYSTALGGVKLKVLEEDASRAKEIIGGGSIVHNGLAVEGGLQPEAVCPKCNSPEIGTINYTRKFAAISLLVGLPVLFFIKRIRCSECGHRWRQVSHSPRSWHTLCVSFATSLPAHLQSCKIPRNLASDTLHKNFLTSYASNSSQIILTNHKKTNPSSLE